MLNTMNKDQVSNAQDWALVNQIRQGSDASFEKIMRDNNQPLFRIVRTMVLSDEEAEDIIQESYVRAYQKLASFKGGSKLSTWLVRIAINEVKDRRRKERQRSDLEAVSNIVPLEAASVTWINTGTNPEADVAGGQIRVYLEKAISSLPRDQRDVFTLRAIQEYSTQETAEFLDIKPETVKTRFHRAKENLKRLINQDVQACLEDTFPFAGARCDRIVDRVMTRLFNHA